MSRAEVGPLLLSHSSLSAGKRCEGLACDGNVAHVSDIVQQVCRHGGAAAPPEVSAGNKAEHVTEPACPEPVLHAMQIRPFLPPSLCFSSPFSAFLYLPLCLVLYLILFSFFLSRSHSNSPSLFHSLFLHKAPLRVRKPTQTPTCFSLSLLFFFLSFSLFFISHPTPAPRCPFLRSKLGGHENNRYI